MYDRRASRTAEATAAIRACHFQYDTPRVFEDPYALALTSPLWRGVCRSPWLHRLVVRGALRGLRPVHGWILVRDRLTEDELRRFVDAGGRQFVLLGAGFDSTAIRRPHWLEGVRIFEIDHPATQAVKLRRMANFAETNNTDDFEALPLDFERGSLADRLQQSTFDPAVPAMLAWQGVIYYLSTPAIEHTLRSVHATTAVGSELMFDFLLPRETGGRDKNPALSLARLVTAPMGERYISYHTVDDLVELLGRTGFTLEKVWLHDELQATYFGDRDDDLTAMPGFGIALARKVG